MACIYKSWGITWMPLGWVHDSIYRGEEGEVGEVFPPSPIIQYLGCA